MKRYFCLSLILIPIYLFPSCEEMDLSDNSLQGVTHAGSVYLACAVGPYEFSLDSLKQNCSQSTAIINNITSDNLTNTDSSFVRCTYDYKAASLSSSNWDFKIIRSLNNFTQFELEWQNNSLPHTLITSTPIDGVTYNAQEYPFYEGYEIDIDSDTKLHIRLFNVYLGGCLHDLMVWELEEI